MGFMSSEQSKTMRMVVETKMIGPGWGVVRVLYGAVVLSTYMVEQRASGFVVKAVSSDRMWDVGSVEEAEAVIKNRAERQYGVKAAA